MGLHRVWVSPKSVVYIKARKFYKKYLAESVRGYKLQARLI